MKAKIGCAMLLCLMGYGAGAAESGNMGESIESDPIDFQVDDGGGDYVYLPEEGYLGNDRATLLVEVGGKKVRMEYFFRVMKSVFESPGEDNSAEFCPEKVRVWKISSITDTNGNKYISAVAYQSPTANADGASATDAGSATMDAAALTAALGSNFLNSLATGTPGVTVNIADLLGGAVGQTTGATITLDTNASGHNWFIDTTPADNSEYLPTSNPYEWVAKAGTAAYGKMDMLSVLLHEYGHALGIEHSADNHDYMATTLTPGVRRLPSAEELTLMQQLVAHNQWGQTRLIDEKLSLTADKERRNESENRLCNTVVADGIWSGRGGGRGYGQINRV